MAKKPETRTAYRDSVDGQFIKKEEAEKRPRETEKERVPMPNKGKGK